MLLSKSIPAIGQNIAKVVLQHKLTLAALLVMTGLSLVLNKYKFGVNDQIWYIARIKLALNPALYPGDPVFNNLMAKGGDVLIGVTTLVVKLLGFEWAFFILHLLAVFATYGMVFLIGNWLQGREAGLLAVLFCTVRKLVGGTEIDTLEEGFHPRTLILPVSLLALYLCWRGRYGWAIVAATAVAVFHPISGVPVLFIVLLAATFALYRNEINWQHLILPIGVLATAGLVVLLGSAKESAGGRYFLVATQDWLQLVYSRLGASVLPWRWDFSKWLNLAIWLGLILLGLRVSPAKSANRFTYILIGALALLVAITIVFSELIPLPVVIQLQFARSLVLLILVSCVYGAILVLHLIRQASLLFPVIGAALAILLTAAQANPIVWGAVGIILIFTALNLGRLRPPSDATALAMPAIAGPGVLALMSLILLGIAPGVTLPLTVDWPRSDDQIMNGSDPWIKVQLWAREHTAADSIFLTPFDHDGFRVYSERRPLVEWKEGGIGLFDPEFGFAWRDRFQAEVDVFGSKPPKLDKFNQFYARYRFDYMVLYADWPSPPKWTRVYSNDQFAVYQAPD